MNKLILFMVVFFFAPVTLVVASAVAGAIRASLMRAEEAEKALEFLTATE